MDDMKRYRKAWNAYGRFYFISLWYIVSISTSIKWGLKFRHISYFFYVSLLQYIRWNWTLFLIEWRWRHNWIIKIVFNKHPVVICSQKLNNLPWKMTVKVYVSCLLLTPLLIEGSKYIVETEGNIFSSSLNI